MEEEHIMRGLIKPTLALILFFISATHVCSAKNDDILSGRDLLRVIREKDSGGTKPAYINRLSKSTKLIPNNNQSDLKTKAAKKIPTDYKDTRSSEPHKVSLVDIKSYSAKTEPHGKSKENIIISNLSGETPLAEAISILRNSVEPPLNIVVMWRDLEHNADVYPTTPINIDVISGVHLGTALKLVLESVSSITKLDYVIKNGVIIISTEQTLPKRLETRVYNVGDFLGQPAFYRGRLGSPSRGTATNGFSSLSR